MFKQRGSRVGVGELEDKLEGLDYLVKEHTVSENPGTEHAGLRYYRKIRHRKRTNPGESQRKHFQQNQRRLFLNWEKLMCMNVKDTYRILSKWV